MAAKDPRQAASDAAVERVLDRLWQEKSQLHTLVEQLRSKVLALDGQMAQMQETIQELRREMIKAQHPSAQRDPSSGIIEALRELDDEWEGR